MASQMWLGTGFGWLLMAVSASGQSDLVADATTSGTTIGVATDRAAVIRKALPYIEEHGVKWMETRRCTTCHHSTFMVWSLNAANSRGVDVDATKLADWNAWTRDPNAIFGLCQIERSPQPAEKSLLDNPDAVTQLLLGSALVSGPASRDEAELEWARSMSASLLAAQQPDGSWKPGGQLPGQKRPLSETTEVSTYWSLAALHLSIPGDDRVVSAQSRAEPHLQGTTGGLSTEWWAARLTWAKQAGRDDIVIACRDKLLEGQRPDGGWGWLLADESDALGTGIAVSALRLAGVESDDTVVEAAIAFLASTQNDDGSWSVKGTKANRRDKIEPTAVFWGTCRAVIAIADCLPESGS